LRNRFAPSSAVNAMISNTRIKVEHLYKVFGNKPRAALDMLRQGKSKSEVLETLGVVVGLADVSFAVPAGSIYMIMGLSGSGKSTLARCLNRLHEPTTGKILLDGSDICVAGADQLRDIRRNRMSMVFQNFGLLPHRTVIDNVEFGLKLRGMPATKRRGRAEEVLAIVGLTQWAGHMPDELSGGMRQRVGLARALATDADVLIMDEAFSALDPLIRSDMQDELLHIQNKLNKTIVFITHDFQEALKLGTRIALMSEGSIVREGTPQEIVLDPGSDYVAAFTRDVDRARLFDAESVMTPLVPLWRHADRMILGQEGGTGFLVDAQCRAVGYLTAAQVEAVRHGALNPDPNQNVKTVRTTTKLVDAAAHCNSDEPVGVTDADGKLLGMLDGRALLSRIGTSSRSKTHHA